MLTRIRFRQFLTSHRFVCEYFLSYRVILSTRGCCVFTTLPCFLTNRLRGHVDDWKANREPLIVRKKYKKKKINVKWGSQTAGQSALSGGTPRARKVQTALMDGRGTSISSMTTNASVLEQQREFIANNSIDINHMTRAA
eukprot:GHVU01147650.1.p1 GENE.GHVU01147650.1~~GHVU01147650.1.p1  ORF type:complete len:140 (+),score=14.03 GHVU01147650.1:562-981(+)